jgi:hypothetical protein
VTGSIFAVEEDADADADAGGADGVVIIGVGVVRGPSINKRKLEIGDWEDGGMAL